MGSNIPALQYTSIESIPNTVNKVRATFHTQKTKEINFRLVQLRKLYWGLRDNEAAILEACKKDLGKGVFESVVTEIDWCANDTIFCCKNLAKWTKDESAPDIPLTNKLLSPKIRKDPLGCVLIIGAYNFPVQLTIGPLIGAIAAGNTAVLKPSEVAPNVAAIIQHIIETYLDPTCYSVVQGGIPETTKLLEQKWDKIFYTGNATVGTIIAKKAAETLTPVTLELGGRNPAIVTKNADVRLAARRLLWAKTVNAGQVCTSQNYTLIDKEIVPGFIEELKSAMEEFFPSGVKSSEDFGRIVSGRQWTRLKKMVEETKGEVLIGGEMIESERYIAPTVILVDSPSDSLLTDESFGPLLPILPVNNLDEAIKIANEIHSTPLGLYPFGNKKDTDRALKEIRSGGASVNDGLFHSSMPTLAFGGVGDSGQGNYRGKASFDCFTHRRSIVTTPGWMEGLLAVRYPPFKGKVETFRKQTRKNPDFDRNGKVNFSLVTYVLTLGARSKTGGLVRYALVLLTAFGIRQYLNRR